MPDTPEKPEKLEEYSLPIDKEPITTEHSIGKFAYSVTVGMLPIKSEIGEVKAGIFYTAYRKKGGDASRPLMFSFNGGPGSSSVWLHLGALAPKRVEMKPDGGMPAPPYKLVDNPHHWLEHTDIVFIDPVGTGFSRPAKKDGGKEFWSLEGDADSVAEFIRLYLSKNHRWTSPLYLVGESYGTTRAAALSDKLFNQGIALNGIILVSAVLNFQTNRFSKGNDLPYLLFFPTYAATAWYHKKTKSKRSLEQFLKEVERFVESDYRPALAKGDRISSAERKRINQKLASFTGLSLDYLNTTDLRIQIHRFCKELLRREHRTVGRLDSRFKGIDGISATENPDHDPSMTAILPPYTAAINDLIRRQYQWDDDSIYYVFNPGELYKSWSYGDASAGHPDTSEALRSAMSKNPFMKILVTSGYYDLATPYYATEYTLSHMSLDPTLRKNITTTYYPAGHMMYIDEGCLMKLNQDVSSFLTGQK